MRTYTRNNDDGSIHVLGNGKMCVYELGHDIIQLFGMPYSSPTFCDMTIDCDSVSERTANSCVYNHKLSNGAEITDFVHADEPCFIRKINTETEFEMKFNITAPYQMVRNDELKVYRAYPGTKVYANHVSTRYSSMAFTVRGNITLTESGMIVGEGESYIYFTGCQEYNECIEIMEKILNTPYDELYADTLKWWSEYLKCGVKFNNDFDKIIEEIAVLIKAQQDKGGGVLAGYNYHLAYMRDQYGVSRGLLAMGHTEEAKNILRHYKYIWEKEGTLHNAQGMGVDSIFHIHENDNAEITGYLIIQAFDLYKADGDTEFLDSLLPMLRWAMECQIAQIYNGMLPFNGDETYVAGGILPRHTLIHGSAEATLLFIKAGELYCNYTNDRDGFYETVKMVKDSYKTNFIKDGFIIANNPKRMTFAEYPRFRYGVCEKCHDFYWNEKTDNGRYLCPKCHGTGMESAPEIEYILPSVALVPFFMDIDFITIDDIKTMIDKMIADYKEKKILPSTSFSTRNTGYDYGLFLTMLIKLDDPLKDEIYNKIIELLDDSGAWVEYYDDAHPSGTRCRPWESGINISACVEYNKI